MSDNVVEPRIRSSLFELTTTEPGNFGVWTLRAISALFATLLIWACLAKLDVVSVAQGRLVPETYVKIVQPTDAGIVREIRVKEGDQVAEGQVLIRMDPTESGADRRANGQSMGLARLQVRAIQAELANARLVRQGEDDAASFAQIDAQFGAARRQLSNQSAQAAAAVDKARNELASSLEILRKLEQTAPLYRRSAEAYAKLAAQSLVGKLDAEDRARAATEREQDFESQKAIVDSLRAAVTEAEQYELQLASARRSELQAMLVEASARAGQLEQADVKFGFKERNLELKAPQAGVVKDLATTTVGTVVQPGTILLNLVPVGERLRAEVSIANEDVGFIRPGQAARLKLATYPFQRYGVINGTVVSVAPDATSLGDGTPGQASVPSAYKALIELERQELRSDAAVHGINVGMQLAAEIVERQRSVIEYLLSPVRKVSNEAAQER